MKTNSARASMVRARAGLAVLDQHGLQRLIPEQFPYLRAQQDFHVRDPLDLVDQVPRHGLGQVLLADDQGQLRDVPGRNTVAWPAELPPPTITTGSPRQTSASACDAA